MFCKTCGTELPEGVVLCPACGGEVRDDCSVQTKSAPVALGTAEAVAVEEEEKAAAKVAIAAVAIIGLIILVLMQFHECSYCGATFFGKSYRAQGYDFLCPDCGSRNAPFVVENDFLAL